MEEENRRLRDQVAQLQDHIAQLKQLINTNNNTDNNHPITTSNKEDEHHYSHFKLGHVEQPERLSNYQISRYGRHLLIPEFGVKGQLAIAGKSVLVVGAGGLGCPVSLYLATSGIGRMGIIDYDVVEQSNLHRQVVHPEANVGISKSLSIKREVLRRNAALECIAYDGVLTSENALDILRPYDVIVDASDNVPTRYLINDACVVLRKPLVSGSALKWEGQVSVYNFKNGPCYRCIFPTPPDPNTVTRCSDGGVIGAGIIGCIQALEAIKVLSGCGDTLHGKLLFFDGVSSVFRTVKLRTKQPTCAVCGTNPTITDKLPDYPLFCGAPYSDKAEIAEDSIPPKHVVTCQEYHNISQKNHFLIDVRDPVQYEICALPNSTNIPLDSLEKNVKNIKSKISDSNMPVCRRGWDSQTAVETLLHHGISNILPSLPSLPCIFDWLSYIYHIAGGLVSWAETVDEAFPIY